jgi:DNA polymerase-3 subunit alpha
VAKATRDELTSRGVLVLDLLEFCVLDDIQRQVSVAQRRAGEGVDLAQLPLDDGDTFELLQRGDTSGIFQLASDEQRQVLIAFAPCTFADLVALLALTHEKTKETMAGLLRRRQGSEPIAYAHPMLEPVLRETVGLFIYAEQVQQAITILSGHTPGQAAILTRILEWKTDDGRCADARRRIICGCIAGGIPGKYAAALVDELEAAAGRTVSKASVASYALLSYWLAYLKAHDPEERQTGGNT